MVTALWNFAADCYDRPGVAEACLYAQDHFAADVNMLLAAAWLAARGARWQRDDVLAVTALCADWRKHCVEPLRAARRYLKHKMGADDMYAQVKAVELGAETYQLRLLESILTDFDGAGTCSDETLTHNLQTYFNSLPSAQPIAPATLAQLVNAIRPTIT